MSERDKIAVVKERIENLLADLENLCGNADEDENEVGKAFAAGVCSEDEPDPVWNKARYAAVVSEDRDDHVPGYD